MPPPQRRHATGASEEPTGHHDGRERRGAKGGRRGRPRVPLAGPFQRILRGRAAVGNKVLAMWVEIGDVHLHLVLPGSIVVHGRFLDSRVLVGEILLAELVLVRIRAPARRVAWRAGIAVAAAARAKASTAAVLIFEL